MGDLHTPWLGAKREAVVERLAGSVPHSQDNVNTPRLARDARCAACLGVPDRFEDRQCVCLVVATWTGRITLKVFGQTAGGTPGAEKSMVSASPARLMRKSVKVTPPLLAASVGCPETAEGGRDVSLETRTAVTEMLVSRTRLPPLSRIRRSGETGMGWPAGEKRTTFVSARGLDRTEGSWGVCLKESGLERCLQRCLLRGRC